MTTIVCKNCGYEVKEVGDLDKDKKLVHVENTDCDHPEI